MGHSGVGDGNDDLDDGRKEGIQYGNPKSASSLISASVSGPPQGTMTARDSPIERENNIRRYYCNKHPAHHNRPHLQAFPLYSPFLFAAMPPHTFLDDALQPVKIIPLSNSFKVTKILILLDGRRPSYTVIRRASRNLLHWWCLLSLPHSYTSPQEDPDLTFPYSNNESTVNLHAVTSVSEGAAQSCWTDKGDD
jgi:hypothetical protein